MNFADYPNLKTVEELRAFMEKVSKAPVDNDKLIWFACWCNAKFVSEACSLKDIANMFLEGIKPMTTLEQVQEYIDTIFEDLEPNEDGFVVGGLVLTAQVYEFCGDGDAAVQLYEFVDNAE